MEFPVITKPERKPNVPKPHIKAARRVPLPDGEHWVEIVGGFSHEERKFNSWFWEQAEAAQAIEDKDAQAAALEDLNAFLATFFDLHVVDHNLTYPGTDEPMPKKGFDLFWELPVSEVWGIHNRIIQPPSFFEDPKAEASSTTG